MFVPGKLVCVVLGNRLGKELQCMILSRTKDSTDSCHRFYICSSHLNCEDSS